MTSVDIDEISEEVYDRIRAVVTKEQMGELIHQLLSCNKAPRRVQDVAVRMAAIFTTKEGCQ